MNCILGVMDLTSDKVASKSVMRIRAAVCCCGDLVAILIKPRLFAVFTCFSPLSCILLCGSCLSWSLRSRYSRRLQEVL